MHMQLDDRNWWDAEIECTVCGYERVEAFPEGAVTLVCRQCGHRDAAPIHGDALDALLRLLDDESADDGGVLDVGEDDPDANAPWRSREQY